MGKQQTVPAGAPTDGDDARKWDQIDRTQARREVRRLQIRIAKAVKEGRASSQRR
jgi:RNA-directed DNA polymerase